MGISGWVGMVKGEGWSGCMGRLTFVLKGRGARGEERGARSERKEAGPVLDRPSMYRSLAPGPRYRIVVPAVGPAPAPAPCLYPSRVLARSLARSLVHVHALTDTLVPPPQRARSEQVLKALQNHPDAWTRVDSILETTQNNQTKFYALSILESVITTRWGALPEEQREGIKTYVSNLIIKISTDEGSFRSQRTFLGKLNLVLVDVLKQDWPHRWPSFIPDIVGASKTNEGLCENSMAILRLLSEEVFDFSKNSLTVRYGGVVVEYSVAAVSLVRLTRSFVRTTTTSTCSKRRRRR